MEHQIQQLRSYVAANPHDPALKQQLHALKIEIFRNLAQNQLAYQQISCNLHSKPSAILRIGSLLHAPEQGHPRVRIGYREARQPVQLGTGKRGSISLHRHLPHLSALLQQVSI